MQSRFHLRKQAVVTYGVVYQKPEQIEAMQVPGTEPEVTVIIRYAVDGRAYQETSTMTLASKPVFERLELFDWKNRRDVSRKLELAFRRYFRKFN